MISRIVRIAIAMILWELFIAMAIAHTDDAPLHAKYHRYTAPDGQHVVLPDPDATPGIVDPTLTREAACKPQRLRKIDDDLKRFRRNVTAMQSRTAYRMYGVEKRAGVCCEVDHRCPIKLCGSDDQKNLWPQPYRPMPGAFQKDRLENKIVRMVCVNKTMTLTEGQAVFFGNWYEAYVKYIPKR